MTYKKLLMYMPNLIKDQWLLIYHIDKITWIDFKKLLQV